MAEKKHAKKEKKKTAKAEMAELKETLQRLQAEFENSRKRLEKEKEDFSRLANAALVKELLPVLDSIDSAEKGLKSQAFSKEKAVEGIELIKKQLLAILSSQGLEEIKSTGQRFDPMLHECLTQACEKEKEDQVVLQELQKGYMLNKKVLRHAKVKVNKK